MNIIIGNERYPYVEGKGFNNKFLDGLIEGIDGEHVKIVRPVLIISTPPTVDEIIILMGELGFKADQKADMSKLNWADESHIPLEAVT